MLINSNPFKSLTVLYAADLAFRVTGVVFGTNTGNTCNDAFRHAFWAAASCNLTGGDTDFVNMFLTAHESEVPANEQLAVDMDLHNNAEGISYYTTHSGDWEYKLVLGVKNNLLCAGELVKFQNPNNFNSYSSTNRYM